MEPPLRAAAVDWPRALVSPDSAVTAVDGLEVEVERVAMPVERLDVLATVEVDSEFTPAHSDWACGYF